MKKKKKQYILKASNIEAEYAFSRDKSIKIFEKSETTRLIQLRTNHFLFILKISRLIQLKTNNFLSASETSRLVQLRTNHFLFTSYKKMIGNQIEDVYTFFRKEAIMRNHLILRYITLKMENLDLIRKYKLDIYKITGYDLAEERGKIKKNTLL